MIRLRLTSLSATDQGRQSAHKTNDPKSLRGHDLKASIFHRLSHGLERYFPEKRMFLRSDTDTRFIRLHPFTQLAMVCGGAVLLGWTILATSILLMDSIGSGSAREQAIREQKLYEDRLNTLSTNLKSRSDEALQAQQRFNVALQEVSQMQSLLLASEDRRKELETGIDVIQATLQRVMKERDESLEKSTLLVAELKSVTGSAKTVAGRQRETEGMVDYLTAELAAVSKTRDENIGEAASLTQDIAQLNAEAQLERERHNRIFTQLEEAVTISLVPLDKMFNAAGLPADRIIETVRRGYSGQGGPLTPLSMTTQGGIESPVAARTNSILERLDNLNLYRIAAEKAPFAMPVKASYRHTSSFGYRRDPKTGGRRMHSGTDFAAASGTPIYATADGVVSHAAWSSGYGRLIKIKHEFGIETRYAHLLRLRVKPGQRVSRGERIGDMGNSGRSTGTHLHYEIRIGGNAVNPMTYIKAARDVF